MPPRASGEKRKFELQVFLKVVCIHFGQFENASQCPRRQFRVQWNDAANVASRGPLLQNDVTASLSDSNKPQALECAYRFRAGDLRQLRHTLPRT